MHFISTFLFFIITYLVLIYISIEASPTKLRSSRAAETSQLPFNESPYWEYILREFVFKTISSLPQSNSILYKKLFEAPFYGGPLLTLPNEDNALLSSGDVYHLPDGRWILCQEGCQNCKLCLNQKDSLVKWTLKKVKRNNTSSDLYGFDLLLTVVPQRELTVTEETHIDRTRFSRSWRRMQRDQTGDNDELNKNINRTEEFVSVDNSTAASSLTLKDDIKNLTDTSPTHQLILGTDQLGNKHVIHILSMNSSEKSDIYNDIDYQFINNAVKLSQSHLTVRKPPSPYRQYVKKVLDSIYSHRPIVEKFLSYNQLNQDKRPIILFPIYSELMANDTNDFK
ncbi:uncharacterized protein LOC130674058 isoform X2 [Microplitis mediator]|uniref:uncharacterized protein LOC130674058 isoform X2 n=1 Tax=Microplitis mediator TaxID=375433 RepID=UPI00255441B8|nr:uncharacterized protein LOC130674058 isoform X2 [Microplitis mediator]